MGPVFPCGCMTVSLGLPLVFWSTDLDCANTAVEAHKTKAVVRAKNLSDMPGLKGPTFALGGRDLDGQPAKQNNCNRGSNIRGKQLGGSVSTTCPHSRQGPPFSGFRQVRWIAQRGGSCAVAAPKDG